MIEENSSKTYRYVNQSECDGSYADEPAARLRNRGFWRRLGLYNTLLIFLSPCAILFAIALLVVVWYGSHQVRHRARPPALWNTIHQQKWEPQITTLASTLIRVSTAAQMGLFASMVAAILLQTTGVSIQQLPRMSIIRAINSGPPSHAWNIIEFLRRPSVYSYVYCLSIFLAVMNSLALQFTSTILLSDFNNTLAVLGVHKAMVRYGMGAEPDSLSTLDYMAYGVDYSKAAPASYPAFAELSEGSVQGPDYTDTGNSLRAFLPIATVNERQRLQTYSGPATVLNARTICIRPELDITNITSLGGRAAEIEGNIRGEGTYPNLKLWGPNNSTFRCPVFSGGRDMNNGSWPLTLCSLAIESAPSKFTNQFENLRHLGPVSAQPYLFFNTSIPNYPSSSSSLNPWFYKNESLPWKSIPWSRADSQAWTSFSFRNISTEMDITIYVSLCFEELAPSDSEYRVNVEATGEGYEQEEKVLTWDARSRKYHTENIRQMFGASTESLSLNQRGIYSLQPVNNWTVASYDMETSAPYIDPRLRCLSIDGDETVYPRFGVNGCSIIFSTLGATSNVDPVPHLAHISIIQDILKDTRNPALALQAFRTIVRQTQYYDRLSFFNTEAPAQWRSSEDVFIPIQWNGFIVIMALLGLHSILITVSIVLFWKWGNVSLLGNTWLTIAQAMRDETADVVAQARTLTDKEVDCILKSDSRIYKRVKIN